MLILRLKVYLTCSVCRSRIVAHFRNIEPPGPEATFGVGDVCPECQIPIVGTLEVADFWSDRTIRRLKLRIVGKPIPPPSDPEAKSVPAVVRDYLRRGEM